MALLIIWILLSSVICVFVGNAGRGKSEFENL